MDYIVVKNNQPVFSTNSVSHAIFMFFKLKADYIKDQSKKGNK